MHPLRAEGPGRETIEFVGCEPHDASCNSGWFQVRGPGGEPRRVEVRVTAQSEHILARELGRGELTPREREAFLSVAGRRLIRESLERGETIDPVVLLNSQVLFRRPGAQRALLRECGLL